MVLAIKEAQRVKEGNIIPFGVADPVDGSQPSRTENNRINKRPSQKVGSAMPIIPNAELRLERMELGLVADAIPMGIEMAVQMNIETMTSINVLGKREAICLITGSPVT